MLLRELFCRVLKESFSKGSNSVLSRKPLVASVADALRDDAEMHPNAFGGQSRVIRKMSDEAAVTWFLQQLDRMEQIGYEGTISTRDGVNNLWIATRYAEGKDSWEDISGKLQPTIHDYYLLKNRDMLDANHKDIMKFHSVRELSYYMSTHYANKIAELRDKAMLAARYKLKKTIKIVDNEDYQSYIILNRAAACALGLGTSWCTSMSHTDTHFHRYSSRAMLFNIFPKQPLEFKQADGRGRTIQGAEKYQFDAGDLDFKNLADKQVDKQFIVKRFPYLYTDLVTSLSDNKDRIAEVIDQLSKDDMLNANTDSQIKVYNVDDEINKLHKFVNAGYMTDDPRPAALPEPPTQQL